jgi:hypothetical protein
MYLMDSSAPAVNNRKWNLGRLGNGSPRGIGVPPQKRMGQLGQTYSTSPPLNAASYQQRCLRPLPENTFIDAVVPIDATTTDFYYHQESQPGASQGNIRWVCRTKVQDLSDPSSFAAAGQTLYPVQQIDPTAYQAQPDYSLSSTFDLGTFFSKYWPWLALAAGGLIVVKEL